MLHKRLNLWGFHEFVGQDKKSLGLKDAAKGCLTPEVQKYAYGVRFQDLKFQRLAKLKKTKRIRLNITFRPQIAASSTEGFVV